MEQHRCYGCMRLKNARPRCEHCGYSETANNLPHQLPVGTALNGQYIVGRVLGQGGFGITYLGWDDNLDRPVAIKEYFPQTLVNREIAHSATVNITTAGDFFTEGRDKFLREAKTLAKLQNVPEIARVHNFFSANNTAYIIMEYVDGITLQQYVRQKGGRLSPEETMQVLRPVIQALAKVHKTGLVHRDISPDNIMLEREGQVRLLDFGTARPNSNEINGQATHSTQAVLKYGFAPMEQYQSRGNLGPWTDEYALCATAYYCMTGRIPPEASARVMGEAEYQWREIPGLPAHQAAALEKGTSMMVSARFPDLGALEAALYAPAEAAVSQPVVSASAPWPVVPAPVQPAAAPVPGDTAAQLAETQPLRQFTPPPAPSAPAQMPYTAPMDTPAGPQAPYTAPLDSPGPGQAAYTAPLQKSTSQKPSPAVQQMLEWDSDEPEYEEAERPNWRILITPAAVLAVLVVVFLLLASPKNHEQDRLSHAPAETTATAPAETTAAVTSAPTEPRCYQMMADVYIINPLFDSGHRVLGAAILRSQIGTITFLNTLADAPSSAWDISADGDETVMAWAENSETDSNLYDLYIAANGVIYAPSDCTGLFAGYENAFSIDFNGYFDTSKVTDMDRMFQGCSNLTTLDLSGFDTSKVRDMGSMFYDCSGLTSLGLSDFDTSEVRNMENMFMSCTSLTSLDLSGFDTSNVTDMSGMFYVCALTSLDLSYFNTSKVTRMASMFWGCNNLTSINLSGFDTSEVTHMTSMFSGCSGLTTLDLSGFDTSRVADMSWMFKDCSGLTSLDLSGFDTSKVTDIGSMFSGCSVLTSLDLSGFDISKVTDMEKIFNGCDKLAVDNLKAPEALKEALRSSK